MSFCSIVSKLGPAARYVDGPLRARARAAKSGPSCGVPLILSISASEISGPALSGRGLRGGGL